MHAFNWRLYGSEVRASKLMQTHSAAEIGLTEGELRRAWEGRPVKMMTVMLTCRQMGVCPTKYVQWFAD